MDYNGKYMQTSESLPSIRYFKWRSHCPTTGVPIDETLDWSRCQRYEEPKNGTKCSFCSFRSRFLTSFATGTTSLRSNLQRAHFFQRVADRVDSSVSRSIHNAGTRFQKSFWSPKSASIRPEWRGKQSRILRDLSKIWESG